jgi:hypothetical protein
VASSKFEPAVVLVFAETGNAAARIGKPAARSKSAAMSEANINLRIVGNGIGIGIMVFIAIIALKKKISCSQGNLLV